MDGSRCESKRFVSAKDDYNLIVFLANTGIRPSEYYKIKWKDIIVHSQNGIKLLYITVPENTKTGQRIVVSLPEAYTCYENIKSFSKYTKENDYVFTNYDGTSMKNWTKTYKSKLEEWQLYLDDEGNPRPPYSLRHYYATQRLLDSVQVYDLAKIWERLLSRLKITTDTFLPFRKPMS